VRNFRKIIKICLSNDWLEKDPFVKYDGKMKEVETEFKIQYNIILNIQKYDLIADSEIGKFIFIMFFHHYALKIPPKLIRLSFQEKISASQFGSLCLQFRKCNYRIWFRNKSAIQCQRSKTQWRQSNPSIANDKAINTIKKAKSL
jgi:hypothetical protein